MKKPLNEISTAQFAKLKPFLDEQVKCIEQPSFIEHDPVSFMHSFEEKEDQALIGFFAAIMAWGRRDVVIAKVQDLLKRMNHQPAAFIGNFTEQDTARLQGFKHRTFKAVDIYWIIKALQKILIQHHSFEGFWSHCYQKAKATDRELIAVFHHEFFALYPETPRRCRKHISNPEKKSSCKRLYLYLRWVIRKKSPVDLGIMSFMPSSKLIIPLDVHSARQARVLGLLSRRSNDWKAAQQLTAKVRMLDPHDPAKYDYALFGIGVDSQRIPPKMIVNKAFLKEA